MSQLADILLTEERRPRLINDCVRVIEEEVQSKSGVSGLAIKAAFKTVKAFKPGIIPDVVTVLVDDFVHQLEPFYEQYQAEGRADIKAFVVEHADRVAEAMLRITDARAEGSKHGALVKAYRKLRPQGQKQVVAAMPRIGAMLADHGL